MSISSEVINFHSLEEGSDVAHNVQAWYTHVANGGSSDESGGGDWVGGGEGSSDESGGGDWVGGGEGSSDESGGGDWVGGGKGS